MASFSESEKENINHGVLIGGEKQKRETTDEFRLPVDNLSWTSLNKLTLDENVKKTSRTSNLFRESNSVSISTVTGSRIGGSRLSLLGLPRRVHVSEATIIDDDDSDEDEEEVKSDELIKVDEIKPDDDSWPIQKHEERELIENDPQNQQETEDSYKILQIPSQNQQKTEDSYNRLQITAQNQQKTEDSYNRLQITAQNPSPFKENINIVQHTPFRDPNGIPFEYPNSNLRLTQPRQVQFMVPLTPSFSASYMQQPQLPVSDVITVSNKPYYVLSLLGKGGSSKVFLVYEPQKKCLLAIKCIKLDPADESVNGAYKNEIYLLQKLQYSDRVIKLYDFEFCSQRNCLYVVMEKGDTDLSSVIRTYAKNGQITVEMIKFYWSEMLKTVAVIHKAGIIHSDLKPANFLLVGGRMKLIDFGIASSLQTDMTSVIKDVQVGTFNYMSPEAIQDTTQAQDYEGRRQPLFKINVKSDVWSLGCILYNLVYGKTPFQDIRQPVAKMQAIVNPKYDITFPDIPNKQLINVMKKCLLRDQKQRLSIEELLQHPYLQESSNASSPQPSVLPKIMKSLAALTPSSVLKAEREIVQMADNIRKKHFQQ